MRLAFAALAATVMLAPAIARDVGQWEASPGHVREWFRSLSQPDNPAISCCGEADAYWADSFEVAGDQYVAIVTDEREDAPLHSELRSTSYVALSRKSKTFAQKPGEEPRFLFEAELAVMRQIAWELIETLNARDAQAKNREQAEQTRGARLNQLLSFRRPARRAAITSRRLATFTGT
jgi:hypothetical protein